jgi:hypothetical protein
VFDVADDEDCELLAASLILILILILIPGQAHTVRLAMAQFAIVPGRFVIRPITNRVLESHGSRGGQLPSAESTLWECL